MLARVEPFWTWHTPFAWTGYILLLDGIVYRLRGSSWLTANRGEFVFLSIASIPLWVVFEGYNLLIENWHYVNLPRNLLVRYFGYAWAFATISPGIFETAELVAAVRGRRSPVPERATRVRASRFGAASYASITIGAAMLDMAAGVAVAIPCGAGVSGIHIPARSRSTHARATSRSLVDLRAGRYDRLINLLVAGFICGGLWEFWNFWARAKWIYTVPIVGDIKIFEMPVLGYFGFPPFALECFTMYVFTRRLVWRGARRPIGV